MLGSRLRAAHVLNPVISKTVSESVSSSILHERHCAIDKPGLQGPR